jgi:hypothetical protein
MFGTCFGISASAARRWLALGLAGGTAWSIPAAPIQYNRDVRPILAENCFACHGSDASSRKAKLRLDNFTDATTPRGKREPAILPGKPAESEFIHRIMDTGDDIMPPADSHKVLTAQQKKILTEWVRQGAEYQPHWAFVSPQRPAAPAVKDKRWARNDIDRFVLARLEQEKLKPAPEADRATLARRVSLDLIGLPPTPEAVTAFVNDRAPDAYERFVDGLLASPRWGEHRGRYWLDVARYADTHGVHYDNYREMWTYRDWVINALNTNMPFDRFTLEQLAGDLLPDATRDQKIASGFNRCNATSNEGGLIEEEYLVLYARDRTETTAQAWLGLTAGCAVCHDHKYDPFTQKDFYTLAAFFNNTTQKAMDGNIKDTPPVLVIPKPEDEARWSELSDVLATAEGRVNERKSAARNAFTNWLEQRDFASLSNKAPIAGRLFFAALDQPQGDGFAYELAGTNGLASLSSNTNWQSGVTAARAYTISGSNAPALADVGDFERTNAFSFAAWVFTADDKSGALFGRMADQEGKFRGWDLWLANGKPAFHFINEWPKETLKVIARKELPKKRWNHVCVTYDGSAKGRGVKIYVNGELAESEVANDGLAGSTRTPAPFKIGQRDTGSPVEQAGLQELNLFGRELKSEEVSVLMKVPRLRWLATKSATERTADEAGELYTLWLGQLDAEYNQLARARDALKTEEKQIRERGTVAHVMQERTNAPEAYVLFRGDYDKRRDRVTPATPSFLPPMPADLPRTRLGFAQWLTRPENPLMARVTVNRFWQELFGTGLVKTSGDFGIAGEVPSHPELLDWLAVEFRESGWDMKRFYKLLVTSATYRQSAVITPAKLEKDPENRLLARGPRFRMDAEMVRDYALAASGLLVDKVGGPSVKPYQPSGIWDIVGMPGGNTRDYRQDKGDNLYRRSVYTFWKRQAPPASMEIFNAPSREVCTVRRERTSTPLQALVTLNDPQFVEAARQLAQRALLQSPQPGARLDFMARRVLARPLTSRENKILAAGLDDFLVHYQRDPKQAQLLLAVGDSTTDNTLDAPTLAAYTIVASQILNLDETLNK